MAYNYAQIFIEIRSKYHLVYMVHIEIAQNTNQCTQLFLKAEFILKLIALYLTLDKMLC